MAGRNIMTETVNSNIIFSDITKPNGKYNILKTFVYDIFVWIDERMTKENEDHPTLAKEKIILVVTDRSKKDIDAKQSEMQQIFNKLHFLGNKPHFCDPASYTFFGALADLIGQGKLRNIYTSLHWRDISHINVYLNIKY